MELQALRYAAMLSTLDFQDVVTAYETFLSKPPIAQKRSISPTDAKHELLNFLEATSAEEVAISSTPRIILMSPSFSKEVTTTVLWLNDRRLDIRCLQIKPYQIGAEIYLDVEQVVPLPSADAYVVQRKREKADKAERQASTKRRERSVPALVARGILMPDMRLTLVKMPRPNLVVSDDKAKHSTFLGPQGVRWDYDNKEYSLSGLCLELCKQFGGNVGSESFAGPDYWAIEGQTKTLTEMALALDSSQPADSQSDGDAVSDVSISADDTAG